MNGCSFMLGGRTDLKGPVWSLSAKDQGKTRAEGPLHKLSTSSTMLHTQEWVCALEWCLFMEIQYQTYFPMAVMTSICPFSFSWERQKNFLQTWWHAGTEGPGVLLPIGPWEERGLLYRERYEAEGLLSVGYPGYVMRKECVDFWQRYWKKSCCMC